MEELLSMPLGNAAASEEFLRPAYTRLAQRCDHGHFLDAYADLTGGALPPASGLYERLLLNRLHHHLGAMRDARAEVLNIGRRHANSPRAALQFLRALSGRSNYVRAWRFIRSRGDVSGWEDIVAAEWHGCVAALMARLRDRDTALLHSDQSVLLAADSPWIWVERSDMFDVLDDYATAQSCAEHALQLDGRYRPAVTQMAHVLQQRGEREQARALLSHHATRMQSGLVHRQLHDLSVEMGDYRLAEQALDEAEACMPLADKDLKKYFARRRADLACFTRDTSRLRELIPACDHEFYTDMKSGLENAELHTTRTVLPVPFVKQHHMTCGPATLTSIALYWQHTVDHLKVAEAICYDGTSHFSERQWAEQQGFVVREFTLDWPTAIALVNAGIPFTLTSVHATGAHLQAVCGYDTLRNTLILRDPSCYDYTELRQSGFFSSHAAHGPRGMVVLPTSESHRLTGITLPDIDVWSAYFALSLALHEHRRTDAGLHAQVLADRWPEHRLALLSLRALATYDGDVFARLAAIERLLARFPDDVGLVFAKCHALGLTSGKQAQIDWLLPHTSEPTTAAYCAQLMLHDSRQLAEASALNRYAQRRLPAYGFAWQGAGLIEWEKGHVEHATAIYRIAACLQDTDEDAADLYFKHLRHLGDIETGIQFLHRRFERLGGLSSQPCMTLFRQLDNIERVDDAFAVLAQQLQRLPDDGELMLFAANAWRRYGQCQRAHELLARAEQQVKRSDWLFAKSELAFFEGGLADACSLAQQTIDCHPLHIGAHRLVAKITAQLSGREATLAWLQERRSQLPLWMPLADLEMEWLTGQPLPVYEQHLRKLLDQHPTYPWAVRELALTAARQGNFNDAHELIRRAEHMDPRHAASYTIAAAISIHQGDTKQALVALDKALSIDLDNEYALEQRIRLSPDPQERIRWLRQTVTAMTSGAFFGDGAMTLQASLCALVDAEMLLTELERLRAARADLWATHVAVVQQLVHMGRYDQALSALDIAGEKFTQLPRIDYERANVHLKTGGRELARSALRKVLAVNPFWRTAVRLLVETWLVEGSAPDEVLQYLQRALTHTPDNADLLGLLGRAHEERSEFGPALAAFQAALRQEPDERWLWAGYQRVAPHVSDAIPVRTFAESLRAMWPRNSGYWCRYAELLTRTDEKLDALRVAIALQPLSVSAHSLYLDVLIEAGRFDVAALAFEQSPFTELPAELAIRRARLLRKQERNSEAHTTFRTLLDAEPANYQLWKEWADWCDEDGEALLYVEAATRMVALQPSEAVSHGYLGHAHMAAGNKRMALEAFQRAIELELSYSFALRNGLDLAEELGDVPAMRALLEAYKAVASASEHAMRAARLALLTSDEEQALSAWQICVRENDIDLDSLQSLEKKLAKAGLGAKAMMVLADAAECGRISRHGVQLWLMEDSNGWHNQDLMKRLACIRKAVRTHGNKEMLRGAVLGLGQRKDASLLRKFIADEAQLLREDPEAWGLVGYCLFNAGHHDAHIRWAHDWRREDAPGYALDNLALAMHMRRRYSEALSVSEQSFKQDNENSEAALWLALAAFARHDFAELKRISRHINIGNERGTFNALSLLVAAALVFVDGDDLVAARQNLQRAEALAKGADVIAAYRRARRSVVRVIITYQQPLLRWPSRWLKLRR